jgi:hypothetical protein
MIFTCMPAFGGDECEALLLVNSLRQWGGRFCRATCLILEPEQSPLSAAARHVLTGLAANIILFRLPDAALDFPYAPKVFAAAEAEAYAGNEPLVWMDSDTLVLGQPDEFVLPPGKSIGCCPVQLKNISSPMNDPPDAFWQAIYTACDVSPERIFPVTSTVDRLEIRAQFNAGLLVVQPKAGLLHVWRDNFEMLFCADEFKPFYAENRLYQIFIHQAILSATLLACRSIDRFQLFSPRYNVPIFLRRGLPDLIPGPTTCRYDELSFFQNPTWSSGEAETDSKIAAVLETIGR